MSFLRTNLLPRLRLLRTALTRRYIYDDVVAFARASEIVYDDVRGDTGPLDLAAPLLGCAESPPDFTTRLGRIDAFTPPGAPAIFNSEPSVARFLGQLAFHRRPTEIVELGCFVGWTTAHMALALQARGGQGRITAVDYQQSYLDATMANLGRHNLAGLVRPVRGMSLDSAVLAALPARADIVFLDTSHRYPDTVHEVLAYTERLSPGGLLVLHDSVAYASMRRSLAELPDRYHRHTFATERGNGVTVLQLRT